MEHDAGVRTAVFNNEEDKVLTGLKDGKATIWDAVYGVFLLSMKHSGGIVTLVACNSSDSKVLTATNGFSVKIWDVEKFLQPEMVEFQKMRLSLAQAGVLIAIYEVIVARRLVEKYGEKVFSDTCKAVTSDTMVFDFTAYPHLQDAYIKLPDVVKELLDPYIRKTSHEGIDTNNEEPIEKNKYLE